MKKVLTALFLGILFSLAFADVPRITKCDTIRKTKAPKKGTSKIRCKYKRPTQIQGYPCIGWTWFYQDGSLDNFQVNNMITIQGIEIPKNSRVFLRRDGTIDQCYFSKDMTIQGYPCDGGHQKEATGFYPNGNLRFIFLTEQRTIQEIPCRPGGLSIIQFYENGRLKQCELPHDFEYKGVRYQKRTKLYLDKEGHVTNTKREGLLLRAFQDFAYNIVRLF